MKPWHALLLAAIALVLAGCPQITLVGAGSSQVTSQRYTVQATTPWNRFTGFGTQEVWTKDGLGLQELRFYDPVADGQPIFKVVGGRTPPPFKEDMRANDIADLFAATMLASGTSVAETTDLRPFRFSGHRGFRFHVNYITAIGSRYRAEVFGAVIKKRLHIVAYVGHEEFYFQQSRAEVEAMMRSIDIRT